ncbi:MAG: pilus assembly protein N-terminal domain-containing protein [Pseudomonadota bacterium]
MFSLFFFSSEIAAAQDAPPLFSGAVSIRLDHAAVFAVPPLTQLVVVGNPSIADVAKPSKAANVVVLTGKSFGQTNVVLVDGEGNVLAAALVRVEASDASLVTVQRGADSRQTYSCTPNCSPTAALGDSPDAFRSVAEEMATRQSLSTPWTAGAAPLLPGAAAAGR